MVNRRQEYLWANGAATGFLLVSWDYFLNIKSPAQHGVKTETAQIAELFIFVSTLFTLFDKQMKKIGLVGGISWVSTLDYYKRINEGVNNRLGGLHFAECLLYSLNFADVQAVTWENAYELLRDACASLKRGNAEAIALCANTAHLFADRLEAELHMPFIHIVTETAEVLRREGHATIGLLGTKFTMEKPFYRDRLAAFGIKMLTPPTQAMRDYVQLTVKEELGRGLLNQETKNCYVAITQELVSGGATAIVLGCTEIPLLISQADFSVPVFDTVKIHSDAIVNYMVS